MNKASATSDAGLADEDIMSENGDVTQSFEQIEQVKEEALDVAGTDEMRADNLKVEKRRISLEPEEGEKVTADAAKTDEGGRSSLLHGTTKDVIIQNITIDAQPDVAQKNSPADKTPEVSPPGEFEEVDFVDEFDEPVSSERTVQFQPEKFQFQPGKLGINSIDPKVGIVSDVIEGSQAQILGVKTGWKIINIEGTPYSEQTLDAYIAKNEPFSITFEVLKEPDQIAEAPTLKEETKPPITKEETSPPKEGEPLPEITPTQNENPEVTPIAIETPTQDEESAPKKKKKDKKKKKKDKKKKKKKKRKNSESTQV